MAIITTGRARAKRFLNASTGLAVKQDLVLAGFSLSTASAIGKHDISPNLAILKAHAHSPSRGFSPIALKGPTSNCRNKVDILLNPCGLGIVLPVK